MTAPGDSRPTGPSPERRAEVEARMAELREGLARERRARSSNPRSRLRLVMWTAVLIPLLALARPSRVGASGPRVILLDGAGTSGGQRLEEAGDSARLGAGDVVASGPNGALLLQLREGAVEVGPAGRLLVERLGPPSLRLLRAPATLRGPVRVIASLGRIEVPAGVEVEVSRGRDGLRIEANGAGATLLDANGERPVAIRSGK